MSKNETNVWSKLQTLDRRILYAVLVVTTAASLFIHVEIPVNADVSSKDLYIALMDIPPEKTILIESDWTNSTRGESAGHFEALMRILMSRGQKFAIYSLADPQAPQVARDALQRINIERKGQNLKTYEPWVDYMELGYFANAEGQHNSIANDIRKAWSSRKERDDKGEGRHDLGHSVSNPWRRSPKRKRAGSRSNCSVTRDSVATKRRRSPMSCEAS